MAAMRMALSGGIITASNMRTAFLTSLDIEGMLNNSGASKNSLSGVKDMIDDYGAGGFTLMKRLGVYAGGIALLAFGISLLVHSSNAQKLSEAKSSVLPKIMGFLLIFGAVGFVIFFETIGKQLFN